MMIPTGVLLGSLALLDLASAGKSGKRATQPIVTLNGGTIQGQQCDSNPSTNVFQGIPYAQPPVGPLRFMRTQPFNGSYSNSSSGVFDATTQPAPCIQWGSPFDVTTPTPSEDCLYLSVYAPANTTNSSSLPVKVWAYGGSNLGGSEAYPLYNGCNTTSSDALLVAFNYRLGPLGFLPLANATIPGNQAIYDYLQALRWVQNNIARFGGDPSQVMLFGQSSGADNAFVVSALSEAPNLMQAAAFESGGGYDLTPYDLAQLSGQSYARALDCEISDLGCLQNKTIRELKEAFPNTAAIAPGFRNNITVDSNFGVNLPNTTSLNGAVIDNALIREQPLSSGPRVPIITGANEEDASLFTIPFYLSDISSLTEANYTQFLGQWGRYADRIGREYPLSDFNTSKSTSEAVVAAATHIITLTSFTCPTYKSLRSVTAHNVSGYAYIFDHTPHCSWLYLNGGPFPGNFSAEFGPTHTAEINFVFENTRDLPLGNGTCDFTKREESISRTMARAWTNMAATGRASERGDTWPVFRDEVRPRGWEITDAVRVRSLDYSECQFWNEIFVDMGGVGFAPPSSQGNATASA